MVEDGVQGVHKSHSWQVCWLNFILEGGLFSESSIDGGLYNLEKYECLSPRLDALHLLLELPHLELIPQDAYFGSL